MKRTSLLTLLFLAATLSSCTISKAKKTGSSSNEENNSSENTGENQGQTSGDNTGGTGGGNTGGTGDTSDPVITNNWSTKIHNQMVYAIGEEVPYLAELDNWNYYTPITSTYRVAFYLCAKMASSPHFRYNEDLLRDGWTSDGKSQDNLDYVYLKGEKEVRTSYYNGDFYIYCLSPEEPDNYPVPQSGDALVNTSFGKSYSSGTLNFGGGTCSYTNAMNNNPYIQLKKEDGKLVLQNVTSDHIFIDFGNLSKSSPATVSVLGGDDENNLKPLFFNQRYVEVKKVMQITSLGFTAVTFNSIISIGGICNVTK